MKEGRSTPSHVLKHTGSGGGGGAGYKPDHPGPNQDAWVRLHRDVIVCHLSTGYQDPTAASAPRDSELDLPLKIDYMTLLLLFAAVDRQA